MYHRAIRAQEAAGRSGGGPGRLFDLPPRIAAGFTAAILCLGATVVVTTWLEASRDEQARLVQRTTETLRALEALEAAFRAALASVEPSLGAAATWEQELSTQALGRIEPRLGRLEALLAADPGQRARLDQLAPILRGVEARLEEVRAARRRGGQAEASELLESLGPSTLAPADALFRALADAEADRLESRHRAWRRTSVTGAVVFTAATLVLAVLVLFAARLVRAEIRSRERLSAERAEMLALQQQLMATVSHDLRNPLAAMKSAAALIARCEAIDDEHRDDARRVVSNARRMERLIRDLLDFSRLRSGQALPIRPDAVDLVDVCRGSVSDLGRDAEGLVTVERRGDAIGWWDRDRLEQIVTNLVSNAFKYGPPERPVRLLVAGDDGEVRLSVTDEGGALPPELHEAIFEPFRRGVAGDAQEGRSAGLGLYVVRRIAEAHGGLVTVASEPGRGTTFTVTLPRQSP